MTGHLRLEDFRVLLLDMNSTFMFGEDRFGPGEEFGATYQQLGGQTLAPADVEQTIRAAYGFLDTRYKDPRYEDDFPSVDEALSAVAPQLPASERSLLTATFARHECGVVPPAHVEALHVLSTTHELRLLSNIWAPKDVWLMHLATVDVLPLFSRVVFSSDTRSIKPSLRLTRAALDGLDCNRNQVLLVGDSLERDVVAGQRAGIPTAWIAAAGAAPAAAVPKPDYRLTSLLDLGGPALRTPAARE